MEVTKEDLQRRFKEYNDLYFDGKLVKCRFYFPILLLLCLSCLLSQCRTPNTQDDTVVSQLDSLSLQTDISQTVPIGDREGEDCPEDSLIWAVSTMLCYQEKETLPDTTMYFDQRIYIREGQTSTGRILYNVYGNWVREGQSSTSRILYNFDGNWIREGQSSTGRILYNIDGNWIREGQTSTGCIVCNIDGNWIREGQTSTGRILYALTTY